MILKAFKEKSNKKYLNKMLSNRHVNVDNSEIKSLGVVLNADEVADFEIFRALAKDLNLNPHSLKIVAFSADKKEALNSWDLCFNPKDFGWSGAIKNVELQSFLDTKFDALVSYYSNEDLELKLMTASSKAAFKIGILQTEPRLNDLIIKTCIKEFNLFSKELLKYVTILNKIKK
jgi:hypothetical protein